MFKSCIIVISNIENNIIDLFDKYNLTDIDILFISIYTIKIIFRYFICLFLL